MTSPLPAPARPAPSPWRSPNLHLALGTILVAGLLVWGRNHQGDRRQHLPDFTAIDDPTARKEAFFSYLEPHIAAVNEAIARQREQLAGIRDQLADDGGPDWLDRRWIGRLAEDYNLDVPAEIDRAFLDRLLRRVDIVAPSLVMAQAANESAWGTSRFARVGNNLFGMRTYERGTGMVPRQRARGAKWEVAAYDSVRDSIAAYVHNLNTHESYRRLRLIRRDLRRQDQPVSGLVLAGGLVRYSEKGHEYVAIIRSIIRSNALDRYDGG